MHYALHLAGGDVEEVEDNMEEEVGDSHYASNLRFFSKDSAAYVLLHALLDVCMPPAYACPCFLSQQPTLGTHTTGGTIFLSGGHMGLKNAPHQRTCGYIYILFHITRARPWGRLYFPRVAA